jgi:sulfite exporter TauE/SafE
MEFAAINSPEAAFVAGLVTSLHCAGMCGPLACALAPGRGEATDLRTTSTVYHLTRLASYSLLGAVAGGLGSQPLSWVSHSALRWVPWLMVLLFVGLAFRWDRFLPRVPGAGRLAWIWRARLGGGSRVKAAAVLGAATPLLPCGPLYFVAALALLSGSALRGVEFMLAFGLGTVPLLWLVQSQFHRVQARLSPLLIERSRIVLALAAAAMVTWRLRATFGIPGPDPSSLVCF